MSESIQAMRERRNALAKETRNLLDQNPGATWAAEHQQKYDENVAEIERIDASIERRQKILDLDAERSFKEMGGQEHGAPANRSQSQQLLTKWMRGGDSALTAQEWQAVRNTMSTTTNTEGGYTVQTDVAASVIEALKAYGGMREVANVVRTAQGNPINWPTSDGTSEVGELIAQNTTATDADATFGVKTIGAYKFSSKIVTVPIELLQDSTVDIEAFVRARLAQRLGRITNQYFTTGTGTNQPNGIVTAASAGVTGATGQTATVIYDDLVDLEHSVDPAYRASPNCRFMMHDSSVKVIKKIKDSDGRPIWTPSYDAGIRGGAPQELLGYRIQVNQDVATMAASAKSILFGDFSQYVIRDVMELTLFRFTDSAYAKKGQVAFLAWMRADGNLVTAGAPVKYYTNSAT